MLNIWIKTVYFRTTFILEATNLPIVPQIKAYCGGLQDYWLLIIEEEEVMFRRHKISFVQKWPISMINVYAQKIIQQFEIPAACSCFIRSFKLSGGDLSSFWTNKN